jgi:hypothetical protein
MTHLGQANDYRAATRRRTLPDWNEPSLEAEIGSDPHPAEPVARRPSNRRDALTAR